MSHQITKAFVDKFNADITLLLQQTKSKLEPYVRPETQTAEYEYFDMIGPVSAQPYGPRHGDTPIAETPHTRRRVGTSPWIWADLIDKPDRLRMLADPTSAYMRNGVAAFNRRKDDVIIASMLADAEVGDGGKTRIAFPESQIIRENGLITLDMLSQIREMYWNNDVDEEEQIVMAVAPNSISTLIHDDKIGSVDFNTVKALCNGDIDTFMGIKFIRTTRLPHRPKDPKDLSKGYIRTNLVWVKSGVLLSKAEDVTARLDVRPDKKYATQVYVSMDIGGTRMDEEKVAILETLEMKAPVTPAP